MKKIVLPLSAIGVAAAAILAFAAEEASQLPAGTSEHKVLTPADIQWGPTASGVTRRGTSGRTEWQS
jgi:hypothetical protein